MENQKGLSKNMIIIIVVAVVILLIIIGVIMMMGKKGAGPNPNTNPTVKSDDVLNAISDDALTSDEIDDSVSLSDGAGPSVPSS
jgi:flagellar basal body-associated protein FliL